MLESSEIREAVFGIPNARGVITGKYPTIPVLTITAQVKKGTSASFIFNDKAVQDLDLVPGVSSVSFAFEDDTILVGNTTEVIKEDNSQKKLTKNKPYKIRNKSLRSYIARVFGEKYNFNEDVEFVLELGERKVGGQVVKTAELVEMNEYNSRQTESTSPEMEETYTQYNDNEVVDSTMNAEETLEEAQA